MAHPFDPELTYIMRGSHARLLLTAAPERAHRASWGWAVGLARELNAKAIDGRLWQASMRAPEHHDDSPEAEIREALGRDG